MSSPLNTLIEAMYDFDPTLEKDARSELAQLRASVAALTAERDAMAAAVRHATHNTEQITALLAQNAEQARRLSELIPLATELVNALGYWMNTDDEPQECVKAELALGAWLSATAPAQQVEKIE